VLVDSVIAHYLVMSYKLIDTFQFIKISESQVFSADGSIEAILYKGNLNFLSIFDFIVTIDPIFFKSLRILFLFNVS
jgi:hypothetical protein